MMSTEREAGSGSAPRRLLLAGLPVAVFLVLAAVLYVGLRAGDPSIIPSALVGKAAPTIELPPLEGLTRDGAQIPGVATEDLARGEVTLVNIWASWCAPCRQEHPQLMRLAESGVRIVGINYKDNPENARRFLGTLGNPFSAVGVDAKGRSAIDWGVYGVPETFVVDGAGVIRHKHVGPVGAAALEGSLAQAIADAGGESVR